MYYTGGLWTVWVPNTLLHDEAAWFESCGPVCFFYGPRKKKKLLCKCIIDHCSSMLQRCQQPCFVPSFVPCLVRSIPHVYRNVVTCSLQHTRARKSTTVTAAAAAQSLCPRCNDQGTTWTIKIAAIKHASTSLHLSITSNRGVPRVRGDGPAATGWLPQTQPGQRSTGGWEQVDGHGADAGVEALQGD